MYDPAPHGCYDADPGPNIDNVESSRFLKYMYGDWYVINKEPCILTESVIAAKDVQSDNDVQRRLEDASAKEEKNPTGESHEPTRIRSSSLDVQGATGISTIG